MTGQHRPYVFAVVALAVAGTACSRAKPAPWLVNESASLPRGVYRLTQAPASPGAIVALTPPPGGGRYLTDLGARPGARLLKRVAAARGETVCRRGRLLIWPRGAATALPRDRRGRALPQWQGCRVLRADQVLVLGDTPNSFDSRYFGPVRTSEIAGAYREVWRW